MEISNICVLPSSAIAVTERIKMRSIRILFTTVQYSLPNPLSAELPLLFIPSANQGRPAAQRIIHGKGENRYSPSPETHFEGVLSDAWRCILFPDRRGRE
jgi:hypothetical protein